MENHVLLLAMPGDKKSAQQKAKTYDGTLTSQITCPICIKISMELERKPRGVVDTVFMRQNKDQKNWKKKLKNVQNHEFQNQKE